MVTQKNKDIRRNREFTSKVSIFEDLTTGSSVPVYTPTDAASRITARKISNASEKYKDIKQLILRLENGHRVLNLRDYEYTNDTPEERLLKLTHKILVAESKDCELENEFLVPIEKSTSFKQISFGYVKVSRLFYKCVTDLSHMVFLKFSYDTKDECIQVHFNIIIIDRFTMKTRRHEEKIDVPLTNEFKFDILLNGEFLCIVWPYDQLMSVMNIADSCMRFSLIPIMENLSTEYEVEMMSGYLRITMPDAEFDDSVFSEDDVSQRLVAYYSLQTGARFCSKKALLEVSELIYLDCPTDVIYLNTLPVPKWLVLESQLPEATLGKLVFCGISDGHISHVISEINFIDLFSEYKTFFGQKNRKQNCYKICYLTNQLFLWTSKHHILVFNLETMKVDAILQLNNSKTFEDFKNQIHDFIFDVSRDGRTVDVFIKKRKVIVSYQQFILPPLSTLRAAAKAAVLNVHSQEVVKNHASLETSLKVELLELYYD